MIRRPNIVLLTMDTLRADSLGCYGNRRGLTPYLDSLAADGIRFDQAISGGSWTQAAFPPLLTSTYASMYGGCLGPLSANRPSPVERLAEQGYKTAAFSTSPLLSRAYGYQRGFQHFVELIPNESDPPLRQVRGGQRVLRLPLTHYLLQMIGKQARPARPYVSAAEVNESVHRWLTGVEEPFFAWVHYMDAHWPYHLEESLQHPRDIAQAWKDLTHLYQVNWHGAAISPAQREHYIALYEQAVRYLDIQVGQLLKTLDETGQRDNTIIIAVSDHGEEFLERSHWGHGEVNLHDEIIRVPLIIWVPGELGQVMDRQVRTLDIMPTILELCGCPLLDKMEGTSLVPLWKSDQGQRSDRLAISERWRDRGDVSHLIAVRTRSFKLIYDVYDPTRSRLYDLQNDPAERQDVRNRLPDVAQELYGYVQEHLQRAAGTTPLIPNREPQLEPIVLERLRNLGYVE